MWTPDPSDIITAEQKAAEAEQALRLAINAERSRRITAGITIADVHVTGSDEDARNLANLAQLAKMRIDGGDTDTLTVFRDADNVDHSLTPPQIVEIWTASVQYVSALYAAGWALKAQSPIPSDITDDRHWPSIQ